MLLALFLMIQKIKRQRQLLPGRVQQALDVHLIGSRVVEPGIPVHQGEEGALYLVEEGKHVQGVRHQQIAGDARGVKGGLSGADHGHAVEHLRPQVLRSRHIDPALDHAGAPVKQRGGERTIYIYVFILLAGINVFNFSARMLRVIVICRHLSEKTVLPGIIVLSIIINII